MAETSDPKGEEMLRMADEAADAAPDIDQPRSDDDDQETINPNRHLTGGGTAPDLTDEGLTLDDITDLQTGRTFAEEQQ